MKSQISNCPKKASRTQQAGQAGNPGVGVEFTSLQPRHRRQVVAFVEKTLASLVSSSF